MKNLNVINLLLLALFVALSSCLDRSSASVDDHALTQSIDVRTDKTPYVRQHLEELFERFQVEVYFAGHEHDLQYQTPENKYTHHIVRRAGSEVRPTSKLNYTQLAAFRNAFVAVSATTESMPIQFIDAKGKPLFKNEIEKNSNQ